MESNDWLGYGYMEPGNIINTDYYYYNLLQHFVFSNELMMNSYIEPVCWDPSLHTTLDLAQEKGAASKSR